MTAIYIASIAIGGLFVLYSLIELLLYLWRNERPVAVFVTGALLLAGGLIGQYPPTASPPPPAPSQPVPADLAAPASQSQPAFAE